MVDPARTRVYPALFAPSTYGVATIVRPSNLDNPDYAAHAWARYKRLMAFMFSVTLLSVAVILGFLYVSGDTLPIHFYIATGLGITLAMMMAAALMGLVFLSSGTDHDTAIDDRIDAEVASTLPEGERP